MTTTAIVVNVEFPTSNIAPEYPTTMHTAPIRVWTTATMSCARGKPELTAGLPANDTISANDPYDALRPRRSSEPEYMGYSALRCSLPADGRSVNIFSTVIASEFMMIVFRFDGCIVYRCFEVAVLWVFYEPGPTDSDQSKSSETGSSCAGSLWWRFRVFCRNTNAIVQYVVITIT
jgi:hypothetical protein